MPHEKILIQPPDWATPDAQKAWEQAHGLWRPQGLMIQWGPYGESDGAAAVGIGSGMFNESDTDIQRINSGGGKLEDMMMMWFNRSQVNAVIRTLRRARTGAYGADE